MGDYRTTTGEAAPLPPREQRRRRLRWATAIGGGAALLAALGTFIQVPRWVLATGYVTTEERAEVRPAVAGVVAAVPVRSGDTVGTNDLLVQLDDADQLAALEGVKSQLRKSESELARRENEIAQEKRRLEEGVALARLKLRHAESKRARTEELNRLGLAADAAVEDFRLQEQMTKAELASLESRDLTGYEREIEALRHEADSRRDQVERAALLVRQRQIRAPIGGQVVRSEFVVGELVRPDMVLYEIFGGAPRTLKLRIDERHATQVAPGQRYRARLLSYGGLRRPWFEGEVEALRNVIQVDGQKTYRTAYCRFDPHGQPVPPGASAEARIDTGRIAFWLYLLGLY